MMNKNAKKWVDALRSGEYEQGRNQLQGPEGFCCLGVGCVLYEKETGNKLPRTGEGYLLGGVLIEGAAPVREWLGLSTEAGEFLTSSSGHVNSLTDLNDQENYSFEQIADVIERYQDRLFV